jgi:DNA-binding YbaB/EbfC family protein
MFDMIRQAQAMKAKLDEFKKELEAQSFTGSAGNGAITVVMNGKHEVQQVTLSPEAVQNAEKLQEQIREAVNHAGEQVNEKLKAAVGKMTGGLGLPF